MVRSESDMVAKMEVHCMGVCGGIMLSRRFGHQSRRTHGVGIRWMIQAVTQSRAVCDLSLRPKEEW